jgi:hypothetical protein
MVWCCDGVGDGAGGPVPGGCIGGIRDGPAAGWWAGGAAAAGHFRAADWISAGWWASLVWAGGCDGAAGRFFAGSSGNFRAADRLSTWPASGRGRDGTGFRVAARAGSVRCSGESGSAVGYGAGGWIAGSAGAAASRVGRPAGDRWAAARRPSLADWWVPGPARCLAAQPAVAEPARSAAPAQSVSGAAFAASWVGASAAWARAAAAWDAVGPGRPRPQRRSA